MGEYTYKTLYKIVTLAYRFLSTDRTMSGVHLRVLERRSACSPRSKSKHFCNKLAPAMARSFAGPVITTGDIIFVDPQSSPLHTAREKNLVKPRFLA